MTAIQGDTVWFDMLDGRRCVGTVRKVKRVCGTLRWWVRIHGCPADLNILGDVHVVTNAGFIH